jgi:hypothetical protein
VLPQRLSAEAVAVAAPHRDPVRHGSLLRTFAAGRVCYQRGPSWCPDLEDQGSDRSRIRSRSLQVLRQSELFLQHPLDTVW